MKKMKLNERGKRFSDVVLDIATGRVIRRFNTTYRKGAIAECGAYTQILNQQAGDGYTNALAATSIFTGPIPQTAHYTLGSGGAITITLQTPVAGSQAAGGDDGKIAMFSTLTAQAHVVQTAANKIQTNKVTATSSAAIGNFLMLVANGGFWWVVSNLNFTLA